MSMDRPQPLTRIVRRVAVGTVCGFGLLNSATADPSPRRDKTVLAAVPAQQPESAPKAHFDLRLPMNYSAATVDAPENVHSPASSFRRSYSDLNERIPAADLHTDDPSFRMASRSANFVSRVRREGLPFARLWESKSALLSIGLSRSGRPGLWLTQKTR
jgi:hypothetical protein